LKALGLCPRVCDAPKVASRDRDASIDPRLVRFDRLDAWAARG
jgi:hypothetical protein